MEKCKNYDVGVPKAWPRSMGQGLQWHKSLSTIRIIRKSKTSGSRKNEVALFLLEPPSHE